MKTFKWTRFVVYYFVFVFSMTFISQHARSKLESNHMISDLLLAANAIVLGTLVWRWTGLNLKNLLKHLSD